MKLDDMRESDNVEDRRGDSGAGLGGGGFPMGRGGIGIGGILIVLVISYFTGINPATLLNGFQAINGGDTSQQVQQPAPRSNGQVGGANDPSGEFVRKILRIHRRYLDRTLQGTEWRQILYADRSGAVQRRNALGLRHSAVGHGAVYCPNDKKVYLEYRVLRRDAQPVQCLPGRPGRLRVCASLRNRS